MMRGTAADRFAKLDHLEGCLRRHPHWSDLHLSQFCGVSRKTVIRVRDSLEARGDIPAVDQVIRRDGTPYSYRRQRMRRA